MINRTNNRSALTGVLALSAGLILITGCAAGGPPTGSAVAAAGGPTEQVSTSVPAPPRTTAPAETVGQETIVSLPSGAPADWSTLPGLSQAAGGPAATQTDAADTGLTIAGQGNYTCRNGSDVTITAIGMTVTITGDCGTVRIDTNGNIVTLDTTKTLTVGGVGNQITAGSIGAVEISGNANVIVHHGGTPTVRDTGVGNAVNPG